MEFLTDVIEWLLYSQMAMVIGGLICLSVALYHSWLAHKSLKLGFEVESIRLTLVSIEWVLMFIWFKL